MMRPRVSAFAIVFGLVISMAPRPAGTQAPPSNCQPGQDLIRIPEIRSENGRMRAEVSVVSGKRTLWGSTNDPRCIPQDLRYFQGRNLLPPGPMDPAFSSGAPIPGPTLRARVGDLIEIKFQNLVDPQAFAYSLDQANYNPANTTGCDEVYTNQPPPKNQLYPGQTGDVMPNCLHGSSTANIHFHGTHTTPNTTGDNIMLFIRPALRSGPNRAATRPSQALIDKTFAQVWAACEKNGTPTSWQQLPAEWRADQERLLKEYDRTAPYRGKPGALPPDMQLWPPNEHQIAKGVWPQYQLGAYPYCFRLADPKTNTMGQAPGTHWYHAHKHGSTALNVANGMTGVFVIEGQYDDDLRRFYGPGFRDQVLMIQQLSSTPFPALNPATTRPNSVAKPQFSVNGRLNPVVKMRPGEVQLWRIVNGAFRDAVQLQSFAPQGGLAWRQIAQDGVQFIYGNYNAPGSVNRMVNLAPANRVDLLVKAPAQPGRYTLTAQPNEGLVLDPNLPPFFNLGPTITLLTVSVEGQAVSPAQDFIQDEKNFPAFPAYLADVDRADIKLRREVDFGPVHNLIDGQTFDTNVYSQVMRLNTAEEWKVSNEANDKAHPFHIHVNPFQITELFEPNDKNTNTTNPTAPCYVDPMNPQTWKPCTPLPGPFVWWDTFAIPTGKQVNITDVCKVIEQCPAQIRNHTACDPKKATCTLTIPGYFKMRSRFVDFTGTYVIHCHILIHEDRGMMQLVEVVPDKPPYVHK